MTPYWFKVRNQQRHRDTFIRYRPDTAKRLGLVSAETEHHEDASQVTRSSTEAACAILRLPPETMAEIFMFTQLDPSPPDFSKRRVYHESLWCWITITHVCRHWREIALGTQELWAYINIGNLAGPLQIAEYLKRAGTSPLIVIFDGCRVRNSQDLDSLYLALTQLFRVRELQLSSSIECPMKLYDYIFKPAPLLENFSFDFALGSDTAALDMRPFFAGQAPRLKSLTLRNNLLTWNDVAIMQNAKHLCIIYYFKHSPDSMEPKKLSLHDLLGAIAQNSNYESIKLEKLSISGPSFRVPDGQQRLVLPHLKNLEILEAKFEVMSELFRKIDLPVISGWIIRCKNFPIKSEHNPKCVIPRTGDEKTKYQFLTLEIIDYALQITADATKNAKDSLHLQRSAIYHWVSQPEMFREKINITDSLKHICTVMRGDFWCAATELTIEVHGVKELDDTERKHATQEDWTALLKLLPELRKLSVRYITSKSGTGRCRIYRREPHRGLLHALGHTSRTNSANDLLCPNLRELHLCGFDLEDSDEIVRTLEPMQNRKQLGKWLPLLRLSYLPISTVKNMRLLKENGAARTIDIVESLERGMEDIEKDW